MNDDGYDDNDSYEDADDDYDDFVCLLFKFNAQVNNDGHVETVS